MQLSTLTIAAALCFVAASNVYAASSVDLRVTGTITPAACTPALSSGGIVDHGKISFQDLNPQGLTPLPDATLILEVSCDAAALMAVKATDNRLGSAVPVYPSQPVELSHFGLGLTSDGNKIGRYALKTDNVSADGVARGVIESVTGETWLEAWTTVWQPGWMRTVNDGQGGAPLPVPLQNLKADLIVSTWIANRATLPSAEEIQIDGSATLDIVYL